MPYIKFEDREKFNIYLEPMTENINSKGDLTYCLYKLCCLYLKTMTKSYTTMSTLMSCLEDAKLEWYRKKMAPYEDQKILENGDVE